MAIDPTLAQAIVNPVQFKVPDAMEGMGKVLTNAMLMDKLGTSRRERETRNAMSAAYKSGLGADGQYDRAKVMRSIADAGYGDALPDEQKKWYEIDKTKAEAGRIGEEGAKSHADLIAKRTDMWKQRLVNVQNQAQYGEWFNGLYNDEVIGPEMKKAKINPAEVTGRVMQMPAQQFATFLNESKYGEKALKKNVTEINRGNKVDLVSTNELGAPNPSTVYSGTVGVNPNTIVREGGQTARTAATLANQRALLNTRGEQQNVNREDGQVHQVGMQGRTFGQQNVNREDNQAAAATAAEARARVAREAAERKVKQKKDGDLVLASNIFMREMNTKFPEARVSNIEMNNDGSNPRIKLNALPPIRGGPDHYTLRKMKEFAEQRGFMFMPGGLGQASYVVPQPGADPQSLRTYVTKRQQQFTQERDAQGNETLVEKKAGVKRAALPARASAAPKMPDFDKKAVAMFNALYKDSGFVGTTAKKEARIAELRAKLKAVWAAENSGAPVPESSPAGGVGVEDVKGAVDYIQKNRLINSQINKNDRSNNKGAK